MIVIGGISTAVVLLVALSLATLTQVPESHANPFWTLTHPATPTALATATEIPTATTIPPTPTATESEVFQRLYSTVTTNQQATVSYSFLSNDGNNTAWEQTPYGGHQCSFNPPPYHIETFQIGYAYFCYGDPNTSFANFIYTVRTNVVHGDGSSVFVRGSKEFQDFFRLDVGIDGNYFYFIGSQRGNGFSPAIHTGRNVDNVIGVIAQGTRIALFVNRKLLEVVSDTVRTDGTIGVGAFANTENAYVNFTYAQVWQL